ncbi:MAG: NlpC/P60 family protein [Pseudomonadota bacterium]
MSATFGDIQPRQVVVSVADIRNAPDGNRTRQLLYGELVQPLRDLGSHVEVEAKRDGYRGVMDRRDLGPPMAATHWVTSLATHLYSAANMKSPEVMTLSFGTPLTVVSQDGPFSLTHLGYHVPSAHIQPISRRFSDPVAVAELFLGTPYLWGGNSRIGLDCSGLVQVSCLACGIPCPGDTPEQEAEVGAPLPADAPLQRGDILFWKGHVAWVSAPDMLIHANAGYMATVYEPLDEAVARIADQGDGPVTSRKRLKI